MSHPDDGTLQMLLDGELDPEERNRIQAHLDGCAACAARLTEARQFLEQADRLVELVVVPASAPRRQVATKHRAAIRTLAWAASIAVAVGVGYWGRGSTPAPPPPALLQEGDGSIRSNAAPQPAEPAKDAPAAAAPSATTSGPRPTGRAAAESQAQSGEAKTVDAGRADELARKEVATPPQVSAEREMADARSGALAAPQARAADVPTVAWREISMEEAVRLLGGQIRLIDGLTPDRVETGPGSAAAGAEPAFPVVRVVYAAGAFALDQQRPLMPMPAAPEAAAKLGGGVMRNAAAPTWQERGGIRFTVTGSVSAESLSALGARVQ